MIRVTQEGSTYDSGHPGRLHLWRGQGLKRRHVTLFPMTTERAREPTTTFFPFFCSTPHFFTTLILNEPVSEKRFSSHVSRLPVEFFWGYFLATHPFLLQLNIQSVTLAHTRGAVRRLAINLICLGLTRKSTRKNVSEGLFDFFQPQIANFKLFLSPSSSSTCFQGWLITMWHGSTAYPTAVRLLHFFAKSPSALCALPHSGDDPVFQKKNVISPPVP